jgi:hypothetical protein
MVFCDPSLCVVLGRVFLARIQLGALGVGRLILAPGSVVRPPFDVDRRSRKQHTVSMVCKRVEPTIWRCTRSCRSHESLCLLKRVEPMMHDVFNVLVHSRGRANTQKCML